MLNHRRMLLEDYQLSPDLVVACKVELKRLCGGGKELGGRTLHCLMKYARKHPKKGRQEDRLSPQCRRMVRTCKYFQSNCSLCYFAKNDANTGTTFLTYILHFIIDVYVIG